MLNEFDHPSFGPMAVPGLPVRLSESADPDVEPSPTKGEDNLELDADRFDFSEDEFRELEEDDLIKSAGAANSG
jgi:crotonobetainyl-CoA:carnitine CoA-transferase CaiB-like acyl-CoA transferase